MREAGINIDTVADIDRWLDQIDQATSTSIRALASLGEGRDVLRRMKFETIGRHPVEDRALNLIEQLNQTFTYTVALNATRWLLERHPDAGGFHLAPGATMSRRLDIMSDVPDLVGAETFAATHPNSNRKLAKDLAKLRGDPSRYRYAFFYSPGFEIGRHLSLERGDGVKVHCVDV